MKMSALDVFIGLVGGGAVATLLTALALLVEVVSKKKVLKLGAAGKFSALTSLSVVIMLVALAALDATGGFQLLRNATTYLYLYTVCYSAMQASLFVIAWFVDLLR